MASTSVVFDILARDNASAKFDHLGNSIGSTDTKMSKFTGVMKTAGKAAAYGLGAGLVIAAGAAVKFVEAAAQDQQAAELLSGALERNAGATAEQVEHVEKWITAVGRAKGVTDDELRPALARLVTATHDVSAAQDLATLAMDVSAATGKSLESVSTALMKAQNGQVSSLSRLGINTKDAAGETISMTEATKRMADQFGGAAQEKANTFSGKMDRLKLMLSEAGESIGLVLLPYATKFADWIISDGIPKVEKFARQFDNARGEGGRFRDRLEEVWEKLKKVANFAADHKDDILKLAAAFLAAREAARVWTTAQIALNIALSANPIGIVIIAIAGLAAAFLVAYDRSEKFREVVAKVRGVFLSATSNAIGFASALTGKVMAGIANVTSVANRFKDAIDSLIGSVQSLVGWLGNIHMPELHFPDKPDWLPRMGMTGGKGAPGIDVGNAGGALIDSIVKGISKGKVKLDTALAKLKDYIVKHRENLSALLDQRAEIVDAFKGFTSSIFGADNGLDASKDRLAQLASLNADILAQEQDLADARAALAQATADDNVAAATYAADRIKKIQEDIGATTGKRDTVQAEEATAPKGINALLAFQAAAKTSAQALAANVKTLIGKGISRELLTELQGAGEAGQENIALLAQGTNEQIAQANADQLATQLALQEAGLAASAAQGVEAAIAQEQRDIKLAEGIQTGLKALLDEQDKNTVVELHLDGHRILWSLKKIKRQNGGHLGLGDKDND